MNLPETIAIDVPRSVLVDAFLEKVARANGSLDTRNFADHLAPRKPALIVPAIGAAHELGGIYAGMTVHENDPYELVLLPGDEQMNWKDAVAWATAQGGVLPSRFDMLVLWQNLPKEFKGEWYWTSQTYEKDADYAWFQYFGFGFQIFGLKSSAYRCRAVRRVAI